jgi:hypothetical protein
MIVTLVDLQDPSNKLNDVPIDKRTTLIEILEGLRRRRKPFICELMGENKFDLMIGIGPLGCAQYSGPDRDPPYLMALAKKPRPPGYIEFLAGNTGTPIASRFCMPFEEILEIVKFFQETGQRSSDFAWEEV